MAFLNLYWHLGSISATNLLSLSTVSVNVWILRCYTDNITYTYHKSLIFEVICIHKATYYLWDLRY
jgi:hypothetical protein